jgi:hypothetical protein
MRNCVATVTCSNFSSLSMSRRASASDEMCTISSQQSRVNNALTSHLPARCYGFGQQGATAPKSGDPVPCPLTELAGKRYWRGNAFRYAIRRNTALPLHAARPPVASAHSRPRPPVVVVGRRGAGATDSSAAATARRRRRYFRFFSQPGQEPVVQQTFPLQCL